MTTPRPEKILAPAWICLVLALGGCAQGDLWAHTPEEQFPDPTDPAYSVEVLKARAERLRAVERWQTSLDALNQMIEFRRSAQISRDRNGNVVSIGDDSDLQQWRMEMETELLRAKGALRRLERKVKTDSHGKYPPWWPRTES